MRGNLLCEEAFRLLCPSIAQNTTDTINTAAQSKAPAVVPV